MIIKFPSRQELDACFASEAYLKIMGNRVNSVDARALILE
ncbi:MAG: DUF1330 domain-containing protein [Oxalobacter sp.]|nr:DUF1330 domain-containing protein [Oxalobacter sp.]